MTDKVKKNFLCPGLLCLTAFLLIGCSGDKESPGEKPQDTGKNTDAPIRVLTYDSFVSEWGPGPQLEALFEEEYGFDVELISYGDAGQLLSRIIREKNKPQGDIVVGLDNNQVQAIIDEGLFDLTLTTTMPPRGFEGVESSLLFDKASGLIPYDFGYFSLIYDSKIITEPPQNLEDLLSPRFENQLILMDPRTSTPGLGFFYWTLADRGDKWPSYWRELSSSILTITDGWDSGYGLFTAGEAPLVLSYTTSPAYHKEYEDTLRYKAAIFEEGHYAQVEGMGILRSSDNKNRARQFIEFMLSPQAQEILPLTNWMYPAVTETPLPDSFKIAAPRPSKTLDLPDDTIARNRDQWLREWTLTVGQ